MIDVSPLNNFDMYKHCVEELFTSFHFDRRSSQRGFSEEVIGWALASSDLIRKQGLYFYVVNKNKLAKNIPTQMIDKVKNMVIIISSDHVILTAYKNNRGHKHVKLKDKRLAKIGTIKIPVSIIEESGIAAMAV